MSRNVDTALAAKFLVEEEQVDLIAKALEVYFTNGGGKVLAQIKGAFNTERLLQAAMPVVKRAHPKLWKRIVEAYNGPA